MPKTGVTTCDSVQCDRLWNTPILNAMCQKCDFFVATFHHRIPLNISPLILLKILDQLSRRLILIRQHQAVITSVFSVIVLWTSKWNIILWWAGRLLKSRKENFNLKRQKRMRIHTEQLSISSRLELYYELNQSKY